MLAAKVFFLILANFWKLNEVTNQGLFSPRLLKFLGIDFERVHSEEVS